MCNTQWIFKMHGATIKFRSVCFNWLRETVRLVDQLNGVIYYIIKLNRLFEWLIYYIITMNGPLEWSVINELSPSGFWTEPAFWNHLKSEEINMDWKSNLCVLRMLIIDFNMSARMIIGYDSWLRNLEVVLLNSLHIAVDKLFVSCMHSVS
jgi:hypothetical protein